MSFKDFYQERLDNFSDNARRVAWKNEDAQQIRFAQFQRLLPFNHSFSINDLGCGIGDLIDFLKRNEYTFKYVGYDQMEEMINLAREKHPFEQDCEFKQIANAREMTMADFSVASGIFNIRLSYSDDEWLTYIKETISIMNDKSKKGFSFNVLTKYSDAEFMKDELYYADPLLLFDYCKKNFSKNVALLHDYDQYDFTIIVRKQ